MIGGLLEVGDGRCGLAGRLRRKVQAIDDETARPWSRGEHPWWIEAAPRDVLALTRAIDHRIVQVRLDDQLVGALQEPYDDGVRYSGPVDP